MTTPSQAPRLTEGAKKLAKFLKKHGVTQATAAAALGVSDPAVCEWTTGKKRPHESRRANIETWTGGAVPASSWLTKSERKTREVVPFFTRVTAPEADKVAS